MMLQNYIGYKNTPNTLEFQQNKKFKYNWQQVFVISHQSKWIRAMTAHFEIVHLQR